MTIPSPIPCGRCAGGQIKTAWVSDKRTCQSSGRCGACNRVRLLTGSEYGWFVLREIEDGRGQQAIGAGLVIGGPR